MIQSKDKIDEIIEANQTQIQVSVRSIACEENEWSEFIPLIDNVERLLYNSKLIDGIIIKIGSFKLKLNKRHDF